MEVDFRDPNLLMPGIALVAAVAALVYCLIRARSWRDEFGLVDAALLLLAIATGAAAAVPLINIFQNQANRAAVASNLQTLRTQIALYQAQHNGNLPLLFKGTFPQLTMPTNQAGEPGNGGAAYPYGPYLPQGIPPNPFTGVATVTPVKEFPPPAPTGNGGWVFHQESGRIAPDLAGYLNR
jgi:general secretion pathway protein G